MIASALLVVALWGGAAIDDGTAAARRFSDAGKLQYELGRFEDARKSYERAWEAKPIPAFLFNIGQCHFQLGHFQRAIFFYERYLELEPDAENRRLVKELIAEARQNVARESGGPSRPPAAQKGARSAGVAAALPIGGPFSSSSPSSPSSASAEPGEGSLPVGEDIPWGWLGVAGGALAAVAGGALLVWVWGSQPADAPENLGVLDRTGT